MTAEDANSLATHVLLSRVADIWIADEPVEVKTDFVCWMVEQMNLWLNTRPSLPIWDDSPPPEKPALLRGSPQLDSRIWNAMRLNNRRTLRDLAALPDAELALIPNLGAKSIKRLRELAAAEGDLVGPQAEAAP